MSNELQAENERLAAANNRLARQLEGMSAKLEEGRRELLATGWDAGFAAGKSRAMRHMSDEPGLSLKADNPYRKPLPDFGGAIFCKTGDNQ